MKLFVSSVAAFALTVALVGCGGGEAPKPAAAPTASHEAMATPAAADAAAPAGDEKKADAAAPAGDEKKADDAAAPAGDEKKADAPAADAKPEEKKAE